MNLRSVIANQFAYEYKAYDLEGVCSANGIEIDSERIQCIVSDCVIFGNPEGCVIYKSKRSKM